MGNAQRGIVDRFLGLFTGRKATAALSGRAGVARSDPEQKRRSSVAPGRHVRGAAHVSRSRDFDDARDANCIVVGRIKTGSWTAKRFAELMPFTANHLSVTPQSPATPLTVDLAMMPNLETLEVGANVRVVGDSKRLRRLRVRHPDRGKAHELGALPQLEALEYDAQHPMDAARPLNRLLSDRVLRTGSVLVVPESAHCDALEKRMTNRRVKVTVRQKSSPSKAQR